MIYNTDLFFGYNLLFLKQQGKKGHSFLLTFGAGKKEVFTARELSAWTMEWPKWLPAAGPGILIDRTMK